ncbi:MAG: Gfo/Idh/MocA family oxidoreductase [Firmicutes bacterium]|nr:Gfo/Idh/MocA family oxidoreductase [Bacillota bacterium]
MLKVAIIGCGDIAGGYDQKKMDNLIRTHAKAFLLNENATMVAATDTNIKNLENFTEFWEINKGYTNFNEMLDNNDLDILSICTPPKNRFEVIKKAVDVGVKLIFCEKPLAANSTEAKKIVEYCREKQTKIAVNYRRRWDPYHREIQKIIENSTFGKPSTLQCNYLRGISNYGTHIIDLIHFWFGKIKWVWANNRLMEKFEDPSLDVYLLTESGIGCNLLSSHRQSFDLFEYTLIFDRAKFEFQDEGFVGNFYELSRNPYFDDLDIFKVKNSNRNLNNVFVNIIEQLCSCIDSDNEPYCNANDGYRVLKIVDAIKESIKLDKKIFIDE